MHEKTLRIIPLGGLGEIGKNMLALEYEGEIIVVDAGVMFPDETMPGVDFIIPDITYLIERRDRVKAILITHGHEDHIGALSHILPQINVPVYASRLSHGLISVKLKESGILRDSRLNVINPGQPFHIGKFEIEYFRVCHSIPDAMGIAITTPLGTVIHTGDFKIDHTPADGNPTDFSALSKFAAKGVLLLCSDSTYAEVEGYTPSEQIVGSALDRAIGDAEGRVIVATFASLISRIQQIIDAAVKHDRKLIVIGRSMLNNVKMATKMGYLSAPDGTIISINQTSQLSNENTILLATGAQGEPTSALVRIANKEHKNVEIEPGDTVIISASPIPGNETLVGNTIDNLYRQGASVLYSRIAMVHVHGHGSREELKMMLSVVKPKFFVPIHGEYRHLVAHSELAISTGIPPSNTFVLENGDVLELGTESGRLVGKIPAGQLLVNGQRVWNTESDIITQRKHLARHGVVVILITLVKSAKNTHKNPRILFSGVAELEDGSELLQTLTQEIHETLEGLTNGDLTLIELSKQIKTLVSKRLYNETRRRPTILTHIEEL